MLMGTNDGRVQEDLLEIRILGQRREYPRPYARVGPSGKTPKYRVPQTELLGQIPPWTPRLGNPQDGLDEATVILSTAAPVSNLTREHPFDPCPLIIPQPHPCHACRDPKDKM